MFVYDQLYSQLQSLKLKICHRADPPKNSAKFYIIGGVLNAAICISNEVRRSLISPDFNSFIVVKLLSIINEFIQTFELRQ